MIKNKTKIKKTYFNVGKIIKCNWIIIHFDKAENENFFNDKISF